MRGRALRGLTGLLLAAALLCGSFPWAAAAADWETTVLFTHDLHSHFLPLPDGDGGERGGFARLKNALDRERAKHPNALVLDGGDFSVGTLFQTLYTTQAAELRTMGAMGYDAVTAGNHEFDHGGMGFAQMLQAASLSGENVPALVMSNYKPSAVDSDQLDAQRAMASYGVKHELLLERGGITYGIFALMGVDAHESAPTSGFSLEDAEKTARRCVESLEAQGADFIICLSHSGTSEKKKLSEDERLAKEVDGIDLIVSGHSHTTLAEPLVVEDTYIVSAGEYSEYLGSITLRCTADGEKELLDYTLIPIDESIPEDPEIAALVEDWKGQVGTGYLARYGLTYDQELTASPYDLPAPTSGVQEGNSLGELVSDAFLWAVSNLEADAPNVTTVAVTADGVLRAPLYAGPVTASQAFDVLSMGAGEDGTSGYPLVGIYLTGKELKAVMEVDASVTPLMPAAQLYMSGVRYSFNTHRMFFNRVMEAQLLEAPFVNNFEGNGLAEIDDDALYCVITGMYSAQMLGTVRSKSMGLLSLEPKLADGTPVKDFHDCILYDANGSEIKEWYALAAYLQSFGEDGLPSWYEKSDGRKLVSSSLSPIQLLKNLSWIGVAALLGLLLAATTAVLMVRYGLRLKKRRRYGASARSRRWLRR